MCCTTTGCCNRRSSRRITCRLRRAAPGLRLNLPDTIAFPERVCKGTGPYDRLALDRNGESPRYDRICERAFDIPEAHLVGQMLSGHTKILAPFLDVSEPIRWSIGVQPAIRRNTVDDDRSVPEHAA